MRLSMELRLQIISHLSSDDIAALALTSRAFCKLPQFVFYNFILQDFPWLWEAWCPLPYALWATTTAFDLERDRTLWEQRRAHLEHRALVALAEEKKRAESEGEDQDWGSAALDALRVKLVVVDHEGDVFFSRPCEVPLLSKGDTN